MATISFWTCFFISIFINLIYSNEANFNDKRIVGGKPVPITDVPWQALIRQRYSNQTAIQCGAVLIAIKWVLTAAHCIKEPLNKYPIDVYFGVSNVSNISRRRHAIIQYYYTSNSMPKITDPVLRRTVIHIYNPGQYDSSLAGDLLLLELNQSIQISDSVKPIHLSEPNESIDYRIGSVSGYGATSFESTIIKPANILHLVRVPILPKSSCARLYENAFKDGAKASSYIHDHRLLCAGMVEGGYDACIGDSGGPLAVCFENSFKNDYFTQIRLKNRIGPNASLRSNSIIDYRIGHNQCFGQWKLVGIISRGYRCAEPRVPGLYIDIRFYTNWIRSLII